jgi:hypothetical protein
MQPYRKICEILFIDADVVTVSIEGNSMFHIKKPNIPAFAKVGDFLLHGEHGFYDVVDKEGNIVSR